MTTFDVMVLGAGMVGISTALHLLERGRSVALVDRRGAAEETSFGNASLIQTEAIMPYAFPRSLSAVLGVVTGRRTDARVVWQDLPAIAPWLFSYVRHSGPEAVMRTARANVPLVSRALDEHERLLDRANASHLLSGGGYLKLYRTPQALGVAIRENEDVRTRFGIPFEVWDPATLREAEPFLSASLAGAIHLTGPARVSDPSDTGKAYAALFEREGGTLHGADARTLEHAGTGWRLGDGTRARDVVVALGPWSGDLLAAQKVSVPLGFKRGYHMHYPPAGNAVLNHFVIDESNGYVLVPNRRGIRLTTGAEFARRDTPPTPVQLDRVEPKARALFPLGERLSETPWIGARPCLPDLLPMIGPVPGRPGLWANFGHHHLGFTLGPATGRLLAEMITGATPFADPAPYRVDRF